MTRDGSSLLVWRFVRALASVLRWRLLLLVALAVTVAFTEGVGLLLLVPLLASIGLTPSDGSTSRVAAISSRLFAAVGMTPSLGTVLLVFVLVTLAYSAATRAYSLQSPTLSHRFATTLRRRLYAAIVSARWSFVAERRVSDLVHAVTVEADRAGVAAYQLLSLISGVAVAAAYLAVAARLSPGMTTIVVGGGAVLMVLLGGRTRRSEALAEIYTTASRRVFGMASQSLNGLKVAKSVGAEARDVELFNTLDVALADGYHRLLRSFGNTRMRLDVISAIAVSALMVAGVRIFHIGGAGLLLLVFICARIVPRARALQESAQLMAAALPAFRAIESLIADCEERAEPTAREEGRAGLSTALTVDALTYRYASGDRAAVEGVSLTIPAGRTVAIVGASGSGKSTLADLIMGLMPPARGRILVDGAVLDAESLIRWRRSVGYVPQDSFLLHDTIRANLLWAVPTATDAEMWDVLEQSAARGFVEAHPDRLDAVVGDRGLRLSGGERQRLALARALLAKPAVLLLDEATSALDSINEQQILGSLARLHGRLTIVIITHRLSTIRDADFIYVLEKGAMVESGTWAELEHRAGPFAALLDAQRLEVAPVRS